MKLTICLAKTVLIFYACLAPIIIFASSYNLIKGVITGQTSIVGIGPFSLFGFILLPILIIITYRKNKCIIEPDKVSIGKAEFSSSDYSFYINEKHLQLKDRPLVTFLKKNYHVFVIKKNGTNLIVLEEDMNLFKSDIAKMKSALSNNYGKTDLYA